MPLVADISQQTQVIAVVRHASLTLETSAAAAGIRMLFLKGDFGQLKL